MEDDFKASPRVEAYYAVATKQYAKAVPLLRKAMETSNPGNLQFRRSMLEMIIEAARGAGDSDALAAAVEEYDALIEKSKDVASKNCTGNCRSSMT